MQPDMIQKVKLKDLNKLHAYAKKPLPLGLIRMSRKLKVDIHKIGMVGDQVFTDMLGANRMGFVSVMVVALGENETGFVAFKRIFEKMVMNKYHNKRGK